MVQIIPRTRPTFGERVGGGFEKGVDTATQFAKMSMESGLNQKAKSTALKEKLAGYNAFKETDAYQKLTDTQKLVLDLEAREAITGGTGQSILGFERERANEKGFTDAMNGNRPEQEGAQLGNGTSNGTSRPASTRNEPPTKKTDKDYEGEISNLQNALRYADTPAKRSQVESKIKEIQRQQDLEFKKGQAGEKKSAALRSETLPIRKEIAERANTARKGIQDKEKLIKLIDTGEIDDPTFATAMEAIPLNLGKRFLSPETVEYKAGLVQGYGDLKSLFSGATRVKEVEILENKIADIYLTDEQKKAILKSTIDIQKIDLIREEIASELEAEGKDFGILQYNKEIDRRMSEKKNALFDQILDQQKSIIQSAENRKKLPLSQDDPQDLEIIDQILKEAGGDWKAAEKLAKQKGYKF